LCKSVEVQGVKVKFPLKIYCETTIYVSFYSNVYLFAKTELKVILFLYITLYILNLYLGPPHQTFWIRPCGHFNIKERHYFSKRERL
jgi:hypothetical protein